MEERRLENISKTLSYWLRHHPEKINLKVQDNGWVDVNELLEKSTISITFEDIKEVVDKNDKKRFMFNEDFTQIKASQGHSIKVKIEFKEVIPVGSLYHGTQKSFLKAILKEGLKPMSRHHVHLSKDIETANNVGGRRGKDIVILEVNARKMRADGFKVYKSENGVFLVDLVPVEYIKILK